MKTRILSVCFLTVSLILHALAQPKLETIDNPENFGVSSDHLAFVDSVFEQYVNLNKVPGGVVLIAKNGKIIKHDAYGWRDKESGQKQSKDDLFRIASMTKAITAVGAMICLEEGKFALDEPLWWYINEFRNPQILEKVNYEDSSFTSRPARSEITIRQLFNHTSGVGYGFDVDSLNVIYTKNGITEGFETRDITLEENMQILGKLPLLHEPGERNTYGLSFDILGRLIEVVTGQSLDVFFRKRIFDPLGMTDTYFYLPSSEHKRLSKVYESSRDGVKPTSYSLIDYPIAGAQTYFSGGADITCSTLDYAKFAQMVMNGGSYNGNRILSQKTIEWMTKGQITESLESIGWGFGVVTSGNRAKYHPKEGSNYWGGFFSTQCLMDPYAKLIVITMLQVYPFWDDSIHTRIQNISYGSMR